MRLRFIVLLLATNCCFAQRGLQLEIMPGVAGYQGDLAQKTVPFNTIGPSAALNIKYDFGDMVILRSGFAWGKISAADRDNKDAYLNNRDLSFETMIWEGHIGAEVNILDPEFYYSLPYVFTGVALFHFNPYAFDDNNQKVYLQPLSTEGQGLPEYPGREKYSLTQFCIPFGGGWKFIIKNKCALSFEAGFRFLFTDYLDDVSRTYVNQQVLLNKKGPQSVEFSFRGSPASVEGLQRGNADKNDMYGFAGVKFAIRLGKEKK